MATDFGFMPVTSGGHYFISYNTEDTVRVSGAARWLHSSGVPLWYDYGLEYGKEWQRQIATHIHSARAMIMFVTEGMFFKDKSCVREEYEIAEAYNIPIIPVILDPIEAGRLPEHSISWWLDIHRLHNVKLNPGESDAQLGAKIMSALGIRPSGASNQLKVGDYIKFGRYPQTSNTPQPIDWRVLSVENGRVLAISRYGLDCAPFNESWCHATWSNCTLRSWLNNNFFHSAFSPIEQQIIQRIRLRNPDSADYNTPGGADTDDKVFCLTIDEAKELFADDGDRICESTQYAQSEGASINTHGHCWWWLRSPGNHSDNAASVSSDGDIVAIGIYVDHQQICIRPAIYISL